MTNSESSFVGKMETLMKFRSRITIELEVKK